MSGLEATTTLSKSDALRIVREYVGATDSKYQIMEVNHDLLTCLTSAPLGHMTEHQKLNRVSGIKIRLKIINYIKIGKIACFLGLMSVFYLL
jgi:hypothetical protein